MTREERKDAIDIIQSILNKYEEDECLVTEITIGDEDIKAFKMAIKALEQEPTTKNNLGVDCISREQALEPYKILKNTDTLSVYTIRQNLAELPSVTPQEPRKGHWIDTNYHQYYNDGDIETTELRCSCCNEEVEWDIELLHKPYYCENCGADMREVEE